MSSSSPGRMGRRRFLVAVAGAVGAGAAAWALRSDGGAVPRNAAPPPLSALPPVTTAPEVANTTPSQPTTTVTPPPAAAMVGVLCRDAWGARPVEGAMVSHTPVRLTVHHTASVPTSSPAAPQAVRDYQRSHQEGRGWPDIAYHFVIDAAGFVYEGRPVAAVGDTGTDYDPTGHFLVACEGNFNQHDVPEPQLRSLIHLLAWGSDEYRIDPTTITGHRDWVATACPGEALYATVADGSLEEAVRDRVEAGGVGMGLWCGAQATAAVAAIEAGEIDAAAITPWDRHGDGQ